MLKSKNGRNKRRREGHSLSYLIMPTKLRKMAFFTIRTLAAEDLIK